MVSTSVQVNDHPRGRPLPTDRVHPEFSCVLNVTVFAAAMSGQATRHERTSCVRPAKLRASPKQTIGTAYPRRPGTVLSVPPVRRHCAAHQCQPGFIRAARPRRRRPAPPSHRRRRPLSASLPTRRVPGRTGACPCQAAGPARSPQTAMASHPMPLGSLRIPTDAERGAESFPISFPAPRRQLPVARPSPGFVPRHRGTRRVRRLDSHRAPRADLVLPNDVPDRSSDVSLLRSPPRRPRVTFRGRDATSTVAPLLSRARPQYHTAVLAARPDESAPLASRGGAMGHFVTSPSSRETVFRPLRHLRIDPLSLISASRKLVTAGDAQRAPRTSAPRRRPLRCRISRAPTDASRPSAVPPARTRRGPRRPDDP